MQPTFLKDAFNSYMPYLSPSTQRGQFQPQQQQHITPPILPPTQLKTPDKQDIVPKWAKKLIKQLASAASGSGSVSSSGSGYGNGSASGGVGGSGYGNGSASSQSYIPAPPYGYVPALQYYAPPPLVAPSNTVAIPSMVIWGFFGIVLIILLILIVVYLSKVSSAAETFALTALHPPRRKANIF